MTIPTLPADLLERASILERQASALRKIAEELLRGLPGGSSKPTIAETADAILDSFCTIWRSRFAQRYIADAVDKAALGRLLNSLTREDYLELPQVFRRYVGDMDPFVAKQGHSLKWLCAHVNVYRVPLDATDKRKIL